MQAENGVPVYDIFINQGDDFYLTITLDVNLEEFNVDEYEFKFAGRYSLRDKTFAFKGQVEKVVPNRIRLYIPSEITSKLRANTEYGSYLKAYYDVQMSKDGEEIRILQGIANISAGHAYRMEGK